MKILIAALIAILGLVEPAVAQFTPGSGGGFVPPTMPPGVTDGSNAAAGQVGEVISSQVVAASPVPLTLNTAAAVTSISLTPGDWDVIGNVTITPNAPTVLAQYYGAVNNSAALPDASLWMSAEGSTTPGVVLGSPVPGRRFSITTTTTVFLVAQANFSVSTCGASGFIMARRAR